MGPLLAACRPTASMVLVPTGWLGLFPLHAAWTSDTTTPTGRRYALDELRLTYAPNARALQEARRIGAQVAPTDLLAVEEPRPVHADPLPDVALEVAAACAAFDSPRVRRLEHENASLDAVVQALDEASVLHFACHAYARPEEPLDSALIMADDTPLTLRTLLAQRLNARLAVLSACETAQTGRELPDEVVGLPAGLLQAGVAAVIASLWTVPDQATMLLMIEFYERWRRRDEGLAEALRQAQRWLRDATNGDLIRRFQAVLDHDGQAWPPRPVVVACVKAVALKDPDRRSFADPVNWGAFTFVGA
jgi:CHAT domain-containing protein